MRGLLVLLFLASAGNPPDLKTVIRRATDYVTTYETKLGNVVASESYSQTAKWGSSRSQTRKSFADFLIVKVDDRWVGLRSVNTVDGAPVQARSKRFDDLKAESARFNIGDVARDTNVPTFALQVLSKERVREFTFNKDGVERLGNVDVWRVRFKETGRRTIVRSTTGDPLHSNGTLWIEPESGRVLKTEFVIENGFVKPSIKSRMTVTYAHEDTLGVLVPNVMIEHYETSANVIDCRAEYSDFRSFQVDVKFDFGPVLERKPPPEF